MATSYKPADMKLVLLGRRGSGKSSCGNTILGRKVFQSFLSTTPVTTECEEHTIRIQGRKVTVIDTPDFFGDFLPDPDSHMKKCISMIGQESSVFLLVIQLGRFTEGERRIVTQIQEAFGSSVTQNMIVLFSYGDDLEVVTIEDFLKHAQPELRNLVEKCGNRYHVFNNRDTSSDTQVMEILQKADHTLERNKTAPVTQKKQMPNNFSNVDDIREIPDTHIALKNSNDSICGVKKGDGKCPEGCLVPDTKRKHRDGNESEVIGATKQRTYEWRTGTPGTKGTSVDFELHRNSDQMLEKGNEDSVKKNINLPMNLSSCASSLSGRFADDRSHIRDSQELPIYANDFIGVKRDRKEDLSLAPNQKRQFRDSSASIDTDNIKKRNFEMTKSCTKSNESPRDFGNKINGKRKKAMPQERCGRPETRSAALMPQDSEYDGPVRPRTRDDRGRKNKTKNAKDPMQTHSRRDRNLHEVRMVLLGRRGSGKSSCGNTILGRKVFQSFLSTTPVTTECEEHTIRIQGRKVTVIDTPDFFGDFLPDPDSHMKKCISMVGQESSVFLLVIQLGRFTEEEKKIVAQIQEAFGSIVTQNMIVLFSYGDDLEGVITEDFLKHAQPELRNLVEKCGNRYHVFNNRDTSSDTQVMELLQKADHTLERNKTAPVTQKKQMPNNFSNVDDIREIPDTHKALKNSNDSICGVKKGDGKCPEGCLVPDTKRKHRDGNESEVIGATKQRTYEWRTGTPGTKGTSVDFELHRNSDQMLEKGNEDSVKKNINLPMNLSSCASSLSGRFADDRSHIRDSQELPIYANDFIGVKRDRKEDLSLAPNQKRQFRDSSASIDTDNIKKRNFEMTKSCTKSNESPRDFGNKINGKRKKAMPQERCGRPETRSAALMPQDSEYDGPVRPRTRDDRGRKNKTKNAKDPMQIHSRRDRNLHEVRMVLLGRRGSGKSSCGNTILGRKVFQSFLSTTPVTTECEEHTIRIQGRKVTVIDTPDFFGDFLPDPDSHMKKCISMVGQESSVFLLVIQLGRFTEEEKKIVAQIQEAFGSIVTQNMIVLFSYGDDLEGVIIEDFLKHAQPELRNLVEKCGNRYHVFNNRDTSSDTQVMELLQKADHTLERNKTVPVTQKKQMPNNFSNVDDIREIPDTHKALKNSNDSICGVKKGDGKCPEGCLVPDTKRKHRDGNESEVIGATKQRTYEWRTGTPGTKGTSVDFELHRNSDQMLEKGNEDSVKKNINLPMNLSSCASSLSGRFADDRSHIRDSQELPIYANDFIGVKRDRKEDLSLAPNQKRQFRDSSASIDTDNIKKRNFEMTKSCTKSNESPRDFGNKINGKRKKAMPQERCGRPETRSAALMPQDSEYDGPVRPRTRDDRGRKNKTKNAKDPMQTHSRRDRNLHEVRMVLLGRRGSGKSSCGNTILGRKVFQSFLSTTPVTTECEEHTIRIQGRKVTVIDTPDFFGDFLPDPDSHMKKCISMVGQESSVFLLVIQLGRFTEEEKKIVAQIQEAFGSIVTQNMIVLFSYGDDLEGVIIEDFLKHAQPELRNLVEKCGNRYHVFNNRDTSSDTQVMELLQKVNCMLAGSKEVSLKQTNKMPVNSSTCAVSLNERIKDDISCNRQVTEPLEKIGHTLESNQTSPVTQKNQMPQNVSSNCKQKTKRESRGKACMNICVLL